MNYVLSVFLDILYFRLIATWCFYYIVYSIVLCADKNTLLSFSLGLIFAATNSNANSSAFDSYPIIVAYQS